MTQQVEPDPAMPGQLRLDRTKPPRYADQDLGVLGQELTQCCIDLILCVLAGLPNNSCKVRFKLPELLSAMWCAAQGWGCLIALFGGERDRGVSSLFPLPP